MNRTTIIVAVIVLAAFMLMRHLGQARPEAVRAYLLKGARVIDVRTEEEFRAGHLDGTINIPLSDLTARIAAEAPDKDQPLLLHCASGARSGAARRMLAGLGYRNVLNLGSYARAERLTKPGP